MEELLHVTTPAAWAEAQRAGFYPCPACGFIHLCTESQLAFVLARHFAGRTGLLVLHLDPAGLDVRWEDSEPGMPPFPHLYEPLPAAAVRRSKPA
jgi:uncharacterized protein (DUF952 family)